MKKMIFLLLCLLLFATFSNFAQVLQTVTEIEMRDSSSLKRRSIELERVKRDADKPFAKESDEEVSIRFAKIKEDFENIQKLQAEIIKAYTTGKQINYQKISESAAELNKKAIRLEANLFNIKAIVNKKIDKKKQPPVRDLIIELDKALGNFTDSPVFKSSKLIEQKDAEKSQQQLEKVIKLSEILSKEAHNKI
jgi:hypothetical protein